MIKKLSFRTILIILFVIQILMTVGLTGYLSFRNGQQIVNDLAAQLRDEIIARIQQKLDTYLKYPLVINQANVRAIQRGYLNVDLNQDNSRWEFHLWHQMQLFDSVSWIGFGAQAGGEYLTITRTPPNYHTLNQQSLQIAIANQTTGYKISYYNTNNLGQRTQLLEVYPPHFDARTRPWYQAAVKAKKTTWQIYSGFFTPDLSYIAASQPVYDTAGNLLGVSSVDFDLSDLTKFLSQLKIGKSGQTFIINRAGQMVAPSTREKIFRYQNGRQDHLHAIDSIDPLTRATAHYLLNTFDDLQHLTRSQQLNFDINGKHQFLQVVPISDEFQLDWLIVVVVPETDFMAQIDENTRATFFFMLIALILAIIIALLTAHWLAQPLAKLNIAAKGLARGEWEQRVEIERQDEIGELAQSFNLMAEQLKTYYQRLLDANATLESKVLERTKELSQTLEHLRLTQRQLIVQEKMASLGMLTAGIAHEIKNPLNFINNFAVLSIRLVREIQKLLEVNKEQLTHLCQQELQEILQDLQNNADHIYKEGQRADSIVKSMLLHSRGGSGQRQLVDLNALVKEAVNLAYHSMRSQNINFNAEIDTSYDYTIPTIAVIAQDLNRVLINLINNAYYAMLEKQKTMGAYNPQLLVQTKYAKPWIEIHIIDNGIGIPESVREQIFHPFFTTKPAGEGTGLGLSISYDIIVQIHQGKLEVVTEVGQYTQFIIHLPIQ